MNTGISGKVEPLQGDILRLLRTQQRVSHQELARRTGIKSGKLSQYFRGLAPVSRAEAEKIAQGLGLDEGGRDFLLAACGYGEHEQIALARRLEGFMQSEEFAKTLAELDTLYNNCERLASEAHQLRDQLKKGSSLRTVIAVESFRRTAHNQRAIISQIFSRLGLQ